MTDFLKKDFWNIVYVFIVRELKIRYAQTHLGILWIIFPPIMGYFIASFFFGNLLKVSKDIPDYTLFAYCGMMAWYYFSYVISYSSVSLIQNQDIIQKSNMPRIIFPLSRAIVGLLDLILWLFIIIAIVVIQDKKLSLSIIYLPFIMSLNFLAGFSVGLLLASISVRWRDVYQIVPYIIGFTMLVTPVFYHMNMVPNHLKIFLYLNPIALVIELYRSVLIHTSFPLLKFLPSLILNILLLVIGLKYFSYQSDKMAETI